MNQVVLHRHEDYIKEDLEYYFSGERDKNNQVRPDEKIYSMTPFSSHIGGRFDDGKVGNFFYPLAPNSLERIYIGISISLYASYWGSSFLLELLKVLRPGGSIVLPVYPEGQAAEKGYWSRSFLENIFLSRARWTGFSNITAENDGVMSLRFGRKRPDPMPSSIEWFYQERSNLMVRNLVASNETNARQYVQSTFDMLCGLVWQEYTSSAGIEKIVDDYFGRNTSVSIDHIGQEYGLLLNDLILSPYVTVDKGVTWQLGECVSNVLESVTHYFEPVCEGKHQVKQVSGLADVQTNAQVCIVNNVLHTLHADEWDQAINKLWAGLPADGVLVVYEDLTANNENIAQLDSLLSKLGEVTYYSSMTATKIQDGVEISQYSLAIEERLRQENVHKDNVFRVVRKTN